MAKNIEHDPNRLSDVTDAPVIPAPDGMRYAAEVEAEIAGSLREAQAALDAQDLGHVARLLEALPQTAREAELRAMYPSLPEEVREMIPYDNFIAPTFFEQAARRVMTPFQWACYMRMERGAPLELHPDDFRAEGIRGLRTDRFMLKKADFVAPFLHARRIVIRDAGNLRRLPDVWADDELTLDRLEELEEIAPDWRADGGVRIVGCPLLRSIGKPRFRQEFVTIESCPALETLWEEMNIGESLTIRDCAGLRRLSSPMRVGGDLILKNLPLLEELPADLVVGGSIIIENCPRLRRVSPGVTWGHAFHGRPDTLAAKAGRAGRAIASLFRRREA